MVMRSIEVGGRQRQLSNSAAQAISLETEGELIRKPLPSTGWVQGRTAAFVPSSPLQWRAAIIVNEQDCALR
jgi:hypothetical protein